MDSNDYSPALTARVSSPRVWPDDTYIWSVYKQAPTNEGRGHQYNHVIRINALAPGRFQ